MKPKRWKLALTTEQLAACAAELHEAHAYWTDRGFALCRTSGIWRTARHGLCNARLVYRNKAAGNGAIDTLTVIIKGISVRT